MSYSSQEQQLPEFMKVIVYSYKNTNSTMTTGVNVAEEQRPCRSKVLQSTKSDHVWVRVHAVGLNPVDAKNFMGDKLPQSWNTLRSWVKRRIVNRTIPGFDFAGTVVAVASSTSTVTSFQPGDAVYGTMPPLKGTLAEYICAPIDQLSYKPASLSWTQAAALPLVGLTAYQVLAPHIKMRQQSSSTPQSDNNNNNSNSVLIVGGSGGTGHLAIQVARRLGATHVTTICSKRNAHFCRQDCGATHVVAYVF